MFCWFFARHHGGQFILRIDDTDQERHVEESLKPILEGLHWLGIDWDEGPEVGGPHAPYYQSQRSDRYQAAVDKLVASGRPTTITPRPRNCKSSAMLPTARSGRSVYDRRFMAETAADRTRFEALGRRGVVRMKMPRERHAGDRRSGARPGRNRVGPRARPCDSARRRHLPRSLANVVDDYDFEISHVIRAEEHLSNTPRQIFLLEALGLSAPAVCPSALRGRAGQPQQTEQAQAGQVSEEPRLRRQLVEHGRKIAEKLGLETSPEKLQPGDRRLLSAGGLSARGHHQLSGAVGLVARRQGRVLHRVATDRQLLLGVGQQGPSQLRLEKALVVPRPLHATTAAGTEGGHDAAVFQTCAGLPGQNGGEEPAADDPRREVTRLAQAAGERIKTAGDILDYDFFFLPCDRLPCDEKAFQKWLHRPGRATYCGFCAADGGRALRARPAQSGPCKSSWPPRGLR